MSCRDCTCCDTARRVNCAHVTWMPAAQFDTLAATLDVPDDAA